MEDQDALTTSASTVPPATEGATEPHARARLLFGMVLFAAIGSLAFGVIGLFTFSWVNLPGTYREAFNPMPSAMLIGGGLGLLVTGAIGSLLCDIADDLSAIRRRGAPV